LAGRGCPTCENWGALTVEWKGLNEKDHYSVSFQTQELFGSFAGTENIEAVTADVPIYYAVRTPPFPRLKRTALQTISLTEM
jgi:hypothetical protein